jgi:hypothetical protein
VDRPRHRRWCTVGGALDTSVFHFVRDGGISSECLLLSLTLLLSGSSTASDILRRSISRCDELGGRLSIRGGNGGYPAVGEPIASLRSLVCFSPDPGTSYLYTTSWVSNLIVARFRDGDGVRSILTEELVSLRGTGTSYS